MTKKLKEKVALITGAGSGMGRAISQEFAANGASVALVDLNAAGVEETAAGIGDAALAIPGDVSGPLDDIVAKAEAHFGRIDILVNCAGVHDGFVPLDEMDDGFWDKVLDINLRAPFRFIRAVLPGMRGRGSGNIINIASISGFVGGGGGVAYTASKHGLLGLTRRTALEGAPSGIRCNAICPGGVLTGMTKDLLVPGTATMAMVEKSPAGRVAMPEEIAKLALFLASDDADFVNGAAYTIDGAQTVS